MSFAGCAGPSPAINAKMPKVAVSSATGYGIVDRRMHASGPVTRHPTRPVAIYGTADRRMHARDPVTKLSTWPVTVLIWSLHGLSLIHI